MDELPVVEWSVEDTQNWLRKEGLEKDTLTALCFRNRLDGKTLLALNEADFTTEPICSIILRDRKLLYIACKGLQKDNQSALLELGLLDGTTPGLSLYHQPAHNSYPSTTAKSHDSEYCDSERVSPPVSEDGRIPRLPPERTKAFLSCCYVVAVTWITAFVMVIVHDRVPDMKKYPPLPDIFLDNVPHIPWAFDMCEVTGTVLFTMWLIVLVFHKHSALTDVRKKIQVATFDGTPVPGLSVDVCQVYFFGVNFTSLVFAKKFILLRRFFALSGTVFLLRCVTMLITSLSVPGTHLECQPRNFNTHGSSIFGDLATKLSQAYIIWRGAGMSIQGVRTCGDYMFSGHTVALTMLNFFITEYTPRHIYYLHTLSWMMNMFGIFFILAAHEHYSIDVFVAFYISSRLFLYYHTLSNNQALMQRDSLRTRVWFPLFSYFESSVDGIVPNEYDSPGEIVLNILGCFKCALVNIKEAVAGARYQITSAVVPNNPQRRLVVDKSNSVLLNNKNK